ncbi:MAG TPA: restriction endonuclease subunit S [Mycobacteriales bacterium]|nr:restriction endonuclease subunit S [Mycobacteriales bacterium]
MEVLIDHRGKTPGKLGGDWTREGVPAISAIHVKGGRIDWTQRLRYVSNEMFERWMPERVRAGDVLLTSEAPLGSVAEVPDDRPVVISQRLFVLRARRDLLDQRYLRHWLTSPAAQDQLHRRSSGSTVTGIRQAELRQVMVNLPPAAEQRRIVEIVEDHLSRLDAANAAIALASRRLDVQQKAILLNLLPNPQDYPSSWIRSTVGDAGRVELGRQRHPDWHTGTNMKPYLRVANVFEDRIDTSSIYEMHWPEGSFERFRLQPGDVLLNEGQTPELLGRPAMYRGDPAEVGFTNSLIRFQSGDKVLPEFALLVFRRHMHAGRFTREARITTNIAHLSASRLKPIEFPLPPLDEQARIVCIYQEQQGALDRLKGAIARATLHERALRRSLLSSAFSGGLSAPRAGEPGDHGDV